MNLDRKRLLNDVGLAVESLIVGLAVAIGRTDLLIVGLSGLGIYVTYALNPDMEVWRGDENCCN